MFRPDALQPVVYALEGSVAVCGSLIKWLRDSLGLLPSAAHSEEMARSVKDSGGVVIVPAFSGLLAPYWRTDARGGFVPTWLPPSCVGVFVGLHV